MTGPGNEMAADAGGSDRLFMYREQVTRTLEIALAQGRLTEDEYDERIAQADVSQSRAELTALTADLPVGQMAAPTRPPKARDAWVGASLSVIAAGVVVAVPLWHWPGAAILAFLIAAVTVLVAPIITVGVMVDVRRQKRSGEQLPPIDIDQQGTHTPSGTQAPAAPRGLRPHRTLPAGREPVSWTAPRWRARTRPGDRRGRGRTVLP